MEFNKKRITAVLGPTNTGKTHLAVETMLEYGSGIMGFPLSSPCHILQLIVRI